MSVASSDIAVDPAERAARPEDAAPLSGAGERMLALPWDGSSAWMVASTAVAMAFLAALTLALHAGVGRLAASWTGALDRQATVMLILTPETVADAALAQDAAAAIAEVPGVLSAEVLPLETTGALLDPWLGEAQADLLAVRLIDVRLSDPTGSAAGEAAQFAIAEALAQAGHEADVDGHGEWMERLRPAAETIEALAASALVVIGAACGLMIALACSTAMAAQARIIEVLRLVGAYDRYIVRLFVRRFQLLTFAGATGGVALGALALTIGPFGASSAPAETGAIAPLLPELSFDAGLWARFAAIPLCLALIATLAAKLAVEARLRRLEV